MLRGFIALVLFCLAGLTAPVALAQRAGTLISADPIVDTPPGMRAWRIEYRTTGQDGEALRVTGMVVAPREAIPPRPRRVIAWTHGAWGVAEKCAPSLSPDFLTESPALAEMVRRGYVVVAADYPGLGSPTQHGFLLGRETAQSVLDGIRAARAIPGAAAGTAYAVWGESQGGHAALWTASESRRYAPELSLVATVAAAPPTDLAANLRSGSEPNARALLTSFAVYSWSRRQGAPLSTLFKPAVQGVVTRLAQNNCVSLDMKPKLGTILGIAAVRQALRGKDIGKIQPWATIAGENSVVPRAIDGPLMIAQSDKDVIVAPAVTLAFARRYCRLGRPLRYLKLPTTPHEHSARDSAGATLDWIAERFAGARPPDDCRKI